MILTACENLIVPSKPHPCTRPAGALICMDEGVMSLSENHSPIS